MALLNSGESVKEQFLRSVRSAIENNVIDPEQLRMLVVSPTEDRSALSVHFSNEYEDFLDLEYLETESIGHMDISPWLDACDKLDPASIAALNSAEQLRLAEMQQRYRQAPPAISMDTIPEGPWRQRLELLREEMISEVESGLTDAALALAGEFQHVVAVVSKGLIYRNTDHNGLIAFCHESGQGPFFPALVHLPNTILTYPFLKFHDDGFTLFYPEGSIREEDDTSISTVTTIQASKMRYARMSSDGSEFIFRMDDQFEDWRIDGGHIHEEWGDKSEAELLAAFRDFLHRNPGLELDLEAMPHPVKDRSAFQTWMDSLVRYNLKMSYDQMTEILNMGEEAVEAALSIMPDTYSQKHRLLIRRAQKAMEEGHFDRSLKFYEQIDHLSSSYDPELLYLYSVLGKEQKYAKKLAELESEGPLKGEVRLPVWLHRIRKIVSASDELKDLQEELQEFVKDREGYRDQHYAMFPLCLVLAQLGRSREAVALLRRVDFTESFLSEVASTELDSHKELMNAWKQLEEERRLSEEVVERLEQDTLHTEEKEQWLIPTPSSETWEFVVQSELEYEEIHWADFLNPGRLLMARPGRLELLEINLEGCSVKVIQTLDLAENSRYNYCLVGNQLFLSEYKGTEILQYNLEKDSFTLQARFGNSKQDSRYSALGIHADHIYAVTGPALEVFPINESRDEPISRTVFQRSGSSVYFIAGHGDGLYVGSNDVIIFNISNPAAPECITRMAPFSSTEPHFIQFWDHYMLTDYLYDISDPFRPVPIEYICRDHAPLRIFENSSEKAARDEVPGLFASGDSMGLIRQVSVQEDDQANVQIWQSVMDREREFPSRCIYPLSILLCKDCLVSVSRDQIRFHTRLPVIQKPVLNGQSILESGIEDLLGEWEEASQEAKTADSAKPIGGLTIVLESYGAQFRLIPPSSIPSVNANPLAEKHVFYRRAIPDFEEGTIVDSDAEALARFFLSHPRVLDRAAGRLMLSVARRREEDGTLSDPYYEEIAMSGRSWEPIRTRIEAVSVPRAPRDILATKNVNLWNSLREAALHNNEVLEELLSISLEESADEEEAPDIPLAAVKAISRLEDEDLVRRIFLAGISGHLPEHDATSIRQADVESFLPVNVDQINQNYFYILLIRLWKEQPDDKERSILLACLEKIGGDMAAVLSFRLEKWDHPALQNYVSETLQDPYFNYYQFRGDVPDLLKYPDLSRIPEQLLRPHADLIRSRLRELTEAKGNVDALAPYWQMLVILGEGPSIPFLEEYNKGARDYLESSSFGFDRDRDTEDPEVFSLRLERSLKCQALHERLLRIEKGERIPLYDPDWKPEPYRKSWETLWSGFLDYGQSQTGHREKYQSRVLDILERNLQNESEEYSSDLTMAIRFLDYVLARILEDPSIAEASAKLFQALDSQRHRLPEKESFQNLRQKGLLSILQSAWNDLKEKNYSGAHQKCDAVLAMDPSMGQAYFLKGRLIWLENGIQAYLVEAENFYHKATGDRAGLARLYNLTGCAYDELKEPARAIPYFEKAATEVPDEAMYIANIAECHYKTDNAEKALQYAINARDKGAKSEIIQEILENKGRRPV